MREIRGVGLHSGRACSVLLRPRLGPLTLSASGTEAAVEDLVVERTDYGVAVCVEPLSPGARVETVEHLFAALAAFGVRRNLAIEVRGGEVPLADGGAAVFCEALAALAPAPHPSTLVVANPGTVAVGDATYEFIPAGETSVEVTIDFAAPAIGRDTARWDGTREAFVRDVAWARTFGFRSQAARLLSSGRSSGVDPRAVMVLDDDGNVEPPGAPARAGEFARHKLLDLIGDLYLFGGPPRGIVRALRPGHTATREAFSRALAEGIVASD